MKHAPVRPAKQDKTFPDRARLTPRVKKPGSSASTPILSPGAGSRELGEDLDSSLSTEAETSVGRTQKTSDSEPSSDVQVELGKSLEKGHHGGGLHSTKG